MVLLRVEFVQIWRGRRRWRNLVALDMIAGAIPNWASYGSKDRHAQAST